jgi:hypothetical protein
MSMISQMGRLFTFPQDFILFLIDLICLYRKNINKSMNAMRKVPT